MSPRRSATAVVVAVSLMTLWTGACEEQRTSGPSTAPATPAAPLGPPAAPTNLTATAAGETVIALAWAAPTSDATRHPVTGYRVDWSADGAGGWTPVEPAHTGVQTLYRHEGLPAGTTRHYRVFALSAGGDSAASNPATASTEEPVAATVVFFERTLTIPEGKSRNINVFYQVTELGAPLPVTVSAVGGSAGDFELSDTSLEIPAGSDLEGFFEIGLTTLSDDAFAEGDREIALRLAAEARDGVRVVLGDDLPVTIEDSRVMPCSGVALAGAPPEVDEDSEYIRTTLTSEWRSAARSVSMEWVGPYRERRDQKRPSVIDGHTPASGRPLYAANEAFHIESWRMVPGTVTSHIMEVSWPTFSVLELMFRCSADNRVIAACDANGCSLRR